MSPPILTRKTTKADLGSQGCVEQVERSDDSRFSGFLSSIMRSSGSVSSSRRKTSPAGMVALGGDGSRSRMAAVPMEHIEAMQAANSELKRELHHVKYENQSLRELSRIQSEDLLAPVFVAHTNRETAVRAAESARDAKDAAERESEARALLAAQTAEVETLRRRLAETQSELQRTRNLVESMQEESYSGAAAQEKLEVAEALADVTDSLRYSERIREEDEADRCELVQNVVQQLRLIQSLVAHKEHAKRAQTKIHQMIEGLHMQMEIRLASHADKVAPTNDHAAVRYQLDSLTLALANEREHSGDARRARLQLEERVSELEEAHAQREEAVRQEAVGAARRYDDVRAEAAGQHSKILKCARGMQVVQSMLLRGIQRQAAACDGPGSLRLLGWAAASIQDALCEMDVESDAQDASSDGSSSAKGAWDSAAPSPIDSGSKRTQRKLTASCAGKGRMQPRRSQALSQLEVELCMLPSGMINLEPDSEVPKQRSLRGRFAGAAEDSAGFGMTPAASLSSCDSMSSLVL